MDDHINIDTVLAQLPTDDGKVRDVHLQVDELLTPGGVLTVMRYIAYLHNRIIALERTIDTLQDTYQGG